MEIHNSTRQLERAFKKIDLVKTSKNNKEFIKQFIRFLSAQGVKELRQVKYIYSLQKIASWLNKDFDKANKLDILDLLNIIEKSDYSNWTKHDYRVCIKKFYTWLKNKDIDDIDEWEVPKEVKWIKVKAPKDSKKVPSELLTPNDIQSLAEHTRNLREKALLLTLYESGARIGELLNLKIKDVIFDELGAQLNLNGKTGYRKIRIVGSSPAISQWIQHEHPKRHNNEAYLFCSIIEGKEGEMLSYDATKKILERIAKRADFKKKINPHIFRHSRATELAERLNDAPLCIYMGWVPGSQMSRIYTHIQDTDRQILEINGLVKKEKGERGQFKDVICPRCNTKNPYGSKFCAQCSMGLDLSSIENYDKTSKGVLEKIEDSEYFDVFIELVMKKLEEKKQ